MTYDPQKTERIPHAAWMSSQLSIARFSGGAKINGTMYYIDETGDLVRSDVLKREAEEKKAAKKAADELAAGKQASLF